MPRVKFDYVVSFSSEDPDHPASNLLSTEVTKKKWLCAAGESSCSVVLGMSRAVPVASLTVGAHMAALVEVLVGRSEAPDEPFQVLVASSVFLTPSESRREVGGDRVRSFPRDVLCGAARDRPWDRLRLVCSQPYNRHVQFGLSFVHLTSAEEVAPRPVAPPLFPLDVRSDDEDTFTPGELFKKVQSDRNTGSEIRQASTDALRNVQQTSTRLVKTPIGKNASGKRTERHSTSVDRKRDDLYYTEEDSTPNKKIDTVMEKHEQNKKKHDENKTKREDEGRSKPEKRKLDNNNSHESTKKTLKKHKFEINEKQALNSGYNSKDKYSSSRDDNKKITETSVKQDRTNERTEKLSKDTQKKHKSRDNSSTKCPSQLLSGAVVVLSGYQNPERGRLRDLALALGARYQPAWDHRATHLICAFPNTPKMREVKSRDPTAATCTGEWLHHLARTRRLLPWACYHTDPLLREPAPDLQPESDDETSSPSPPHDPRDEEDTEDEIERVRSRQKAATQVAAGERSERSPSPDTEEEWAGAEEEVGRRLVRPLPRPLKGEVVGVRGLGEEDAATVGRYLRACGATVTDPHTEEAPSPPVVVGVGGVSPAWVWECVRAGRRQDPGDYPLTTPTPTPTT